MKRASFSKIRFVVAAIGTVPLLAVAQTAEAGENGKQNSPTGTIVGKVSFDKKTRLKSKRKEFVKVVVSVEDIESSAEDMAMARDSRNTPVIDQKDMTFRPHVLPVLLGEMVDFPNSDPLFHNVYSNGETKRFDLGMYPKGQSKQIDFDKPGIVELRCKVHSEMQAFILIKKNPYFATVQKDGSFRIDNVPVGTHTLEFWHPKAKAFSREVTLEDGSTVELDVAFSERRGRRG